MFDKLSQLLAASFDNRMYIMCSRKGPMPDFTLLDYTLKLYTANQNVFQLFIFCNEIQFWVDLKIFSGKIFKVYTLFWSRVYKKMFQSTEVQWYQKVWDFHHCGEFWLCCGAESYSFWPLYNNALSLVLLECSIELRSDIPHLGI